MDTEIRRLTEFKEYQWDTLIRHIGEGRVVPIIGPELIFAQNGGDVGSFYGKVVDSLSDYFGLPKVREESLSDLVSRVVKELRIAIDDVRNVLASELNKMREKQPILEKLVAIEPFKLFLTTTPDAQLTNTLLGAGCKTKSCYFSSNYFGDGDLPDVGERLDASVRYVYHLFGGAESGTHYAITEDDRLDYVCRWMNMENKPRNLVSTLADKRLLVLGCGYENWLARFFLFGLKGTYLFYNDMRNPSTSLLADRCVPKDVQLDRFLSRCGGNIYCRGDSSHFVSELYERWNKAGVGNQMQNAVFKPQAVFISYAHEDLQCALKIKKRLESAGLAVWLDMRNLDSGYGFDEQIAKNIQNSSFFFPLISKTTAQITERRYFRREWKFAFEEATLRSPMFPFIHPIAVDDVEPCDNLPRQMNELHWVKA